MSEPQQGQGLSFRFDLEKKVLIASVTPDPHAIPIDEAWLQASLVDMGWAALRYSPTAVAELINKYNQAEAVEALCVAECIDAHLEITIAPDGLEARLDLAPPQGGEAIGEGKLLAALSAKGVTEGIVQDAIRQAVAAGEAHGVVVALGRAPVDGIAGRLECLLPATRSRVPKVDEFDHADYRDLGDIQAVHEGERLMLRHPPTPGVAGISVLGKPIPAKAGEDARFAANLTGTVTAPDNPDLLLAKVSGQPVVVPDGIMVEGVYTIEAVNAASGNIRFDGSVVIKGDVMAGMTVQASGDIEVGGVVEAAMLDAGGCIVIKGGAIGSLAHNAKYYLRCGGSFSAGYASQARIEAGDSIFIDDAAMMCDLSAGNGIRVGHTKRGHLIGGNARATYAISARVLGSAKQVTTRCEIGVSADMHKQLQEIVKEREGRETQLFELSKVLDLAKKTPGKFPPEVVDKARKMAASVTATILGFREQQSVLEKKLERARQARVVAEQAFYEGVEVWMAAQRYCVFAATPGGSIGVGDDGLGFLPPEDVIDDTAAPR